MAERKYPGNDSTIQELADYCFAVARDRSLPGILPIMASIPELTPAWTAEGNLEDIPGYLSHVDHCSVGLWQQQADDLGCGTFGWGTRAQLIQVPYALGRFCDVALENSGGTRNANTTDPDILGEWCADVQRPLEMYRHRYRTIGYPLAMQLVPTEDPDEWPAVVVEFQDQGWGYISELSRWVQISPSDAQVKVEDGWIRRADFTPTPPKEQWTWPEARDPVGYLGDGSYIDLHPTRYNWVPQAEKLARYLVDTYEVWVNTYVDHPPGWGRDTTSFDVWGPAGRGDRLDSWVAEQIKAEIFNDPNPPWIDWYIHNEWMWTAAAGWEWFSNDTSPADNGHYRHIHYTFKH